MCKTNQSNGRFYTISAQRRFGGVRALYYEVADDVSAVVYGGDRLRISVIFLIEFRR